jgi:hypothetical protein
MPRKRRFWNAILAYTLPGKNFQNGVSLGNKNYQTIFSIMHH